MKEFFFFTVVQEIIFMHCVLKSQIVKRVFAFQGCFLLSSNLVCKLQVIVGQTLVILVTVGCRVTFSVVKLTQVKIFFIFRVWLLMHPYCIAWPI